MRILTEYSDLINVFMREKLERLPKYTMSFNLIETGLHVA